MVNIFGLNAFLTAASLLTVGIVAVIITGVVVVGAITGSIMGGKHHSKSKAAKKELDKVKNSIDAVEVVKGNNAVEEDNKAKSDELEAERKSNLEAVAQNLDVTNMQPAFQKEKSNENEKQESLDNVEDMLNQKMEDAKVENSEDVKDEELENFLNI